MLSFVYIFKIIIDFIFFLYFSAYDWAYLLKICTNWIAMPEKWSDFQKMLTLFFPRIMDIKTMMNETKIPKSGLQELADHLKVPRVGAQHQAGSDANLTGEAYFRFMDVRINIYVYFYKWFSILE